MRRRKTTTEFHQQLVGEKNNCIIPNTYIAWLDGDYAAAVVLKEIAYWSGHKSNDHKSHWVEMPESEWKKRSHLSLKQVHRAIQVLNARALETRPDYQSERPFIERSVRKVRTQSGDLLQKTVCHYRLCPDWMEELWGYIEDDPGTAQRDDPETDQTDDPQSAQRAEPTSGTPSSTPSSINPLTPQEKKLKQTRATQMPDIFPITDDLIAWGDKHGFTVAQMESQVEMFQDHYRSKGETRKDWVASFRTWMQKAKSWGQLPDENTARRKADSKGGMVYG
jgi:hypothetical protein